MLRAVPLSFSFEHAVFPHCCIAVLKDSCPTIAMASLPSIITTPPFTGTSMGVRQCTAQLPFTSRWARTLGTSSEVRSVHSLEVSVVSWPREWSFSHSQNAKVCFVLCMSEVYCLPLADAVGLSIVLPLMSIKRQFTFASLLHHPVTPGILRARLSLTCATLPASLPSRVLSFVSFITALV